LREGHKRARGVEIYRSTANVTKRVSLNPIAAHSKYKVIRNYTCIKITI